MTHSGTAKVTLRWPDADFSLQLYVTSGVCADTTRLLTGGCTILGRTSPGKSPGRGHKPCDRRRPEHHLGAQPGSLSPKFHGRLGNRLVAVWHDAGTGPRGADRSCSNCWCEGHHYKPAADAMGVSTSPFVPLEAHLRKAAGPFQDRGRREGAARALDLTGTPYVSTSLCCPSRSVPRDALVEGEFMTRITRGAVVALLLGGMFMSFGCRDSGNPVIPGTPVANPPPTTGPQPPPSFLSGNVSDTAFRSLGGVRIEAVDGALAGTSATSTRNRLVQPARDLRRSGDVSCEQAGICHGDRHTKLQLSWTCIPELHPGCARSASRDCGRLYARLHGRPRLPGSAGCRPAAELPGDDCTDAGAAHVRNSFARSAVSPVYKALSIGVAGEYLSIFFGGDWGSLAEQLAPNTYLHIEGFTSVTLHDPVTTITAPFDGAIEHCELKSGDTFSFTCPAAPGSAVSRARCQSKNHMLTLTRR